MMIKRVVRRALAPWFIVITVTNFCSAAGGRPPAPVSPPDGAAVTDIALSFFCDREKAHKTLEIQADRGEDFAAPDRTWRGDEPLWLPEQLFAPGTWYWRARAVTADGKKTAWSPVRRFTVSDEHTRKPPYVRPTADNPFFLLESWTADHWRHVPDVLKPHTAFKIRPIFYHWRLRRNTAAWRERIGQYEKKGVPVFFLGHGDQYPSAELEQFYREFDCVKGVVLRELMWWHGWHGFRGNKSIADLFTRHLALAAKYGKVVIWTDGHWRHLLFLETGVEEDYLKNVIAKHADWFWPVVKLNFAYHPTVCQSLLQGFWLTGAVTCWGHQPESWYHHGGGPGAQWRGPRESCPPLFYPVMVLSGARAGAAVYSFEPPGDIWAGRGGLAADAKSGRTEGFSRTWAEIMVPLMREMVAHKMIPTREQVREMCRVAVTYDRTVFADEQGAIGPYWEIRTSGPTYRQAWKRVNVPLRDTQAWRHEAEVVPNESRYDFLPFVPACRADAGGAGFSRLVPLARAVEMGPAAFRRMLDASYPAPPWTGSAYIQRIGSVYYIINNREERVDDPQDFHVPFDGGPVARLDGTVGRHAFVLVRKKGTHDRIYAHARRPDPAGGQGDGMSLALTLAADDVTVDVRPRGRVVSRKRDGNTLNLRVRFAGGPAIIVVK